MHVKRVQRAKGSRVRPRHSTGTSNRKGVRERNTPLFVDAARKEREGVAHKRRVECSESGNSKGHSRAEDSHKRIKRYRQQRLSHMEVRGKDTVEQLGAREKRRK
ncbi:hypothetical protein TRVL_06144 [Trypanosoma vivax]|nr:hypothetical protein TRVL_06144 [Trypanosoma vivax]